jgi:capsular polysaccharide biosynthesis protein
MSDFSFCEQVALFYNAKEVIGLHGAGFANTIFCKHETKIIEMRPDTAGDVIKNLAINNKLIYHDISCKPKTLNYNNQTGDIEINLKTLEDKLLH